MNASTIVLVLAAGQGKRMRSALPKVLHPLAGRPLLGHVLETARQLQPEHLLVVTGHHSEEIKTAFHDADITWAYQATQLGTAHAVQCALPALAGMTGTLLILSGDTPLVEAATLHNLLEQHQRAGVAVTLVSTTLEKPTGYGRIVRDPSGHLLRVVEEKDATEAQRSLTEVNTGIYCVELALLPRWLEKISSDNAQHEYYLPDIVPVALADKTGSVGVFRCEDAPSLQGVNDRRQLAQMEAVLRDRIVGRLQDQGVTFVDPCSCWVAMDVVIAQDSVILPHVVLGPGTKIDENCRVGPFCEITHTHLGAGCEVRGFCHLEGAVAEEGNSIGPYARLRPGTVLAKGAKVGNFCEVKRSHIGRGSKVSHLSYIGDTQMGAHVNVGAGTITCNYDGTNKHQTVIGDDVFIGSDTQLVAPVQVGHRATIAAGTTVTKTVPSEALAVSRIRQSHVPGWAHRKK